MSGAVDVRLAIDSKQYEEGPRLVVSDRWTGEEIARVVQADASRAEDATVACARAFDATRAYWFEGVPSGTQRELNALREQASGMRAASWNSWSSVPGAGSAAWRTWYSRLKVGSSTHNGRPVSSGGVASFWR